MKVLIEVSAFLLLKFTVTNCQSGKDESGRYVPDDEGLYYPDNSGQYIPDDSGRYIYDPSGNYKGDGTGKYTGERFDYKDNFAATNLIKTDDSKTKFRKSSDYVSPPTYTTPPVSYPASIQGGWKIIRQVTDVRLDGYHWEYETENGITAEERGSLANIGTDAEALRAKGFFQYTGPDNVVYAIQYTADENGFLPEGKHLPTPPPLPEALVKAIEYHRSLGNK